MPSFVLSQPTHCYMFRYVCVGMKQLIHDSRSLGSGCSWVSIFRLAVFSRTKHGTHKLCRKFTK